MLNGRTMSAAKKKKKIVQIEREQTNNGAWEPKRHEPKKHYHYQQQQQQRKVQKCMLFNWMFGMFLSTVHWKQTKPETASWSLCSWCAHSFVMRLMDHNYFYTVSMANIKPKDFKALRLSDVLIIIEMETTPLYLIFPHANTKTHTHAGARTPPYS